MLVPAKRIKARISANLTAFGDLRSVKKRLRCRDIIVTRTDQQTPTLMAQPFIVQRKEVMQKAGIALAGFGLCLLFSSTIHAQHAARTIEVHAHRFAFEPSEIRVTVGETVRLRLISDDVPHSLLVKQLNIDLTTTKSNPGEVVFKADTPGDYVGRCGRFCGSGHGHMVFTVHVSQK
ncbi:MAG: cupredoxin domain-containing protein [Terracidiphilus sp.]